MNRIQVLQQELEEAKNRKMSIFELLETLDHAVVIKEKELINLREKKRNSSKPSIWNKRIQRVANEFSEVIRQAQLAYGVFKQTS